MKDKSRLIGFILSFIPGLAHLYIGLKERAFIFLAMLGAGFLGSIFIGLMIGSGVIVLLFVIGYSILWLIAIIDLFTSWNTAVNYYENRMEGDREDSSYRNSEKVKKSNRRTTALALSIIPGAGHMYLGYEEKGLLIMGGFFFSVFFMGWLGMSFLLFLLPLIWFYSFFDTMHTVDGNKGQVRDKDFQLKNIKPQWIGYGMISIGLIIIIERILYPLIDYRIRYYLQTSLVSLIFIVLGIYILYKNRGDKKINQKEEEDNEG